MSTTAVANEVVALTYFQAHVSGPNCSHLLAVMPCLRGSARVKDMTLSALGLVGGEKVMLEHKTGQGKWPRCRYIEDPGFRQFRENDRVDAMDYQGRWFQGQVGWS